MTEKVKQKPKHNAFDNIWEIRNTRGFETRFKDFLREVERRPERVVDEARRITLTYIYYLTPEAWIGALIRRRVQLPIWKILVPDLPGASVGAIYYIFKDSSGMSHVFRGTYGYGGAGPHESAFIEEFLSKTGYTLELRGGDYLLDIIAWRRSERHGSE